MHKRNQSSYQRRKLVETQLQTHSLLTDLFRVIAEEENSIEAQRQRVCATPQLTVPKAFAELDIITNGVIEADDVIAYEKQFYIRTGQQEAEWLVREYDADEDGMLSEHEFQ